jgi:N-acetylglutamate synthase-like GNAT family acetyltransferase
MKSVRLQWEVDYRDRTSTPFVAYSKVDNECVGCVRLVRSLGREDAPRVALIERLLAQSEGESLLKLFKYPASMQQPFDVLEVFPNFRSRFKELLQKNIDVGEIGRVAVAKDYRRLCLAEVIVDTATSFALSSHLSTMFLACLKTRRLLYEKCGFSAIEGISSPTFFNIVGESIMMQSSPTGAAHAA